MNLAALTRRALLAVQRVEIMPWVFRRALLRAAGVDVGLGVLVVGGVTVIGSRLTLARDAFLNNGVLIDCHAQVTIGEAVHVAPRVQILTSTHALGGPAMRAGEPSHQPVVIGGGSWLGAGAIILPGVKIAPGTVIGAGAVVVRDTEPNGIYAGCPARRIRDIGEDPPSA